MKSLEEEARDLQSQDEQVRLVLCLTRFFSTTLFRVSAYRVTVWLPLSVQAQTTLKIYSMNSDRLNRNLETAGEENALLQESNVQVR